MISLNIIDQLEYCGCLLPSPCNVQGTLPSAVPKAYGPTKKVVCDEDTHSSKTSHRRRPKSGGKGQLELVEEETAGDLLDGNGLNCRPILLPGTLLTLSCDCGCALTDFAEEVNKF